VLQRYGALVELDCSGGAFDAQGAVKAKTK
jgi:hypothetical protein